MSTTTRMVTADELLLMPERDENGRQCRLELIRGTLITKELFTPAQGILIAEIGDALWEFVEDHDLGLVFGTRMGFIVEREPDTVLVSPVSFANFERMARVDFLEKFLPFAPDLIVEVSGEGDTAHEMNERLKLCFAAGSRAAWVFDPKRRTVAVYTSPMNVNILNERDTLDGGDVAPGFTLDLAKLFAVGKK